jgi:FtsP/CotA-like multicopper oxidase with cupredoxin domain
MKTRNYQLLASEFSWKLSNERTIRAWGFNEMLPGPTLRAEKGDKVTVKVVNNLSEPTVIHWHGIRLPSGMDGTDSVQAPIDPGKDFTYEFIVPDAGTFWYHSHQNETYQMERGMYGALIVSDPGDPIVDGEQVFVIDDMKLTSKNEFNRGNSLTRWIERHDGREGSTLLINGTEGFQTTISAGQTERWRFINASSAKYFRLFLGGRKFRIIGTDGGLVENPVEVSELLLTPGERADILVGPFTEGDQFPIESLRYNRMTMIKSGRGTYGRVRVLSSKTSVFSAPSAMRVILPLAKADAAVNRKIKFSVNPVLSKGLDFRVNGTTHAADKPVMSGELQVWEVRNASLMDHPFHLHGYFFQILSINGKAPAFVAWKDTVNLPPLSKVKIAWMPDDRTGRWMYHCHILEHHEAGMMGHFEVIKPNEVAQASMTNHHHHHGTH